MNRKEIWLIIGLMSAAVIGVMSLQIGFIQNSIQLNEDQFNSHILAALAKATDRLESLENYQVTTKFANGYSIRQLRLDTVTGNFQYQQADIFAGDPSSVLQQKMEAAQLKQEMFTTPLEERIEVIQLDAILRQEFGDRGIDVPFSYGVLSNASNTWVIFNNHYVVPNESQAAFDFLRTSSYKVNLFKNDLSSPGYLYVFFPTKTSIVWGDLWLNLLFSLLFVAVILGCFAYTINVIFRQKKLSEMKNDFINNMTHEFKTPIATISLASDSITNPSVIGNPDKIKRFADIIRQENKRMNGQVEKVLQMAVIERGSINLNLSSVDLHQVIEQALGNITLQVERKDGTTKAILNAQKSIIEGDANHISNIINNLLDNANKYSPEHPDITVSTRNVSNGVEVTITDKGIGMTKEAKKKIFEKFYRVHTGNVHDVKGFGLGLSYVKTMITAHKGSIDVHSELGKGSSFVVFFPFEVGQIVEENIEN
jgi:two-component system, OmpR family, phosphate regulon sensor histidine kinase PhoR